MDPDERAIREVHLTWVDAANGGDLQRLLAIMRDPRAAGVAQRLAGDRLTVYRKQQDGHRLLAHDAQTLTALTNPSACAASRGRDGVKAMRPGYANPTLSL